MLRAPFNLIKKAVERLAAEVAPKPDEVVTSSPAIEAPQVDAAVAAGGSVAVVSAKNDAGSTRGEIDPSRVGAYNATERFSIVAAVYNVGRYLDKFFGSIVNQTADFWSCIEVIVVDDGSTDDSAEICRSWVDQYPGNIRYLRQENAGQGAARNNGLRYARNDWVTFIDPDDFVSQDYFEQIDRALKKHANAGRPLRLLATNFFLYYEDIDVFQDGHALRYRFSKGDVRLPASNLGKHVVMHVNCTLFWRRHLVAERLEFDTRIKPSFEDGNFANRYLVSLVNFDVAFLSAPKYYYRKRSDASSTLDTAWEKPERYGDQLRYGYLGLIDYCLERKGEVPAFVQRTLMYDLAWYVKRFINEDLPVDILGEDGVQEFKMLMSAIMSHVSPQVIMDFDLAGVWFYHKVGLLSEFKDTAPDFNIVYCGRYDDVKCLLELKYFSRDAISAEDVRIDGARVIPAYASTRCHSLMGSPFVYERSLWIEVGDGMISISVSGKPARLSAAGKQHRSAVSLQDIVVALRPKAIASNGMPEQVAALRRAAREPAVMRKYAGCWLLMDRDSQADDNAEHLYRFLAREHPEIRAYFVLRSDSPHWPRLESDGFRLIDFGSDEHRLALLNAAHLASSHADNYIFGELDGKHYGDLLRYKYTFLQHGVTHHDLSRWLNRKNISCFIAATKPEYDSIVEGENYKFSSREVILTGFPRHDNLLSLRREPEKMILVMPTWRNSLVGPQLGQGNDRAINPEFHESEYAQYWGGFLRSAELQKIAEREGFKVVFLPHPNIVPYIDGFKLPAYIEVRAHDGAVSIQELFARASAMITDYSSVAFEMAYIERPVIYFQFDRESIYSGAHTTLQGYFDHRRDGFGPVCASSEEVLGNLAEIIRNDCRLTPKYQKRVNETFSLRDGQSCRRTYEAIVALDLALTPDEARQPALLDFARRTLTFGEWQDAYDAWQQLHGSEVVTKAEAAFSLAVCARKLGKFDECKSYLDEAELQGFDASLLLKEQASLAVALNEFEQAIANFRQWRRDNVLDPADARFIADMARAFRLLGKDQRAERLLSEAEDASHPDIRWEWAELASLRQCWEDAAECWSTFVSDGTRPEAALKYAEALLHLDRAEEAHETLARLPWEDMPPAVTRQRAELAFRFLDWKMAVKAWSLLEMAGELTPDEWLKYAKALRKRGEFEHAGQALENAAESTDLRTLMQERALLLSAQGRWVEAVAAWQAFLERRDLSPNRDGWLYLARAQMHAGELEAALRTVRRFARAKGDTEDSLALQAEIELAIEQARLAAASEAIADALEMTVSQDGPRDSREPAGAMA